MIFGVWNREQIWHRKLINVLISPATLPWEIQKIVTTPLIRTFPLFALSQQDNAPAHRACYRVELLHRVTPQFISPDMWPANSPDLNPVDYYILAWHRSVCIEYQSAIRTSCGSGLLRHGLNFCRAWWTMRLINNEIRKKTERTCPCRRWSFWTLAVMLLAWHSSCHTTHHNRLFSKPPKFWRKTIYLQSDEQVLHFTR